MSIRAFVRADEGEAERLLAVLQDPGLCGLVADMCATSEGKWLTSPSTVTDADN